jgi:acyl carrier protein
MPTGTISREQALQVLEDALTGVGAPGVAIAPGATFAELDVDSLDLAEVTQIIEEELGVRIAGKDVATITTVGEAADLVVSRSA